MVKLLWLAIRDIEDKRARERAKQAGRPKNERTDAGKKLVEGTTVQGWNAAYGALSIAFPAGSPPPSDPTLTTAGRLSAAADPCSARRRGQDGAPLG